MNPFFDIQKFWANPSGGNLPSDYASKISRSEFLFEFIKDVVPFKTEIMELGCNCGRNIRYLGNLGYTNVFGIDLSEEAIKYGAGLPIYRQTIEDFYKSEDIPEMVFSMAVLEHLPKKSEWIFEKMADSRYVLTIEDELSKNSVCFPRNYKEIFGGFGMREVKHQTENTGLFVHKFEARLFVAE